MEFWNKHRTTILVLINLGFWIICISNSTYEYLGQTAFYERMEILKEQGKYEAYLDGELSWEVINAIVVPEQRLEKYTWGYCLWLSLKIFLPIILLIYINWLYLLPKMLSQKRYLRYAISLFLLILFIVYLLICAGIFKGDMVLETANEVIFRIPAIWEGFWACFLIILFTTPLYLSYHWFLQQEKITQLKNEQLTTELSFLRSQINPHFFFNTLNNLYALTLEDSKSASAAILKLSDLMRYTIYNGKESEVSVAQEIACIENYLHLQAMRTQREVEVKFERNILEQQQQIPPLLFLSFLENAFKHGVETLRSEAFVHIYLQSNVEQLHLQIRNNYNPSGRQAGAGSGLQNIKRRLALLYPKRHTLQIQDENANFSVELKIQL